MKKLIILLIAVTLMGCSNPQEEEFLDADNDGIENLTDQCPNTPYDESANSDGCSVSQLDSDKDGVANNLDQCRDTPSNVTVDANGCPLDSDNDGVYDYQDNCPDTPAGEVVDTNGCALSQLDLDNDGVTDDIDECPVTKYDERTHVDSTGCAIPHVYLAENGVTIKAQEWAKVGDIAELNGTKYLIVDNRGDIVDWLNNPTVYQDDIILYNGICTTRVTKIYQLEWITSKNPDITNWDVSNITEMRYLFEGATSFNQDISNWDVSKVTNMEYMFYDVENFNQDLSSWDVSNVTNCIHFMNPHSNKWTLPKPNFTNCNY